MSIGAPVAFPALFSFTCVGHGTEDGCAIDLGFPLEGTMDASTESVDQCGCSEHPLTLGITPFGDSC